MSKQENTPEESGAEATNEVLTPEPLQEASVSDSEEVVVEPESVAAPDPLGEMTRDRDEYREKWLRVVAELDNVRKRSSRELVQSRRFSQADVLRSFLDVQDNVERALQSVAPGADNDSWDSFREGVELIAQKIRGVMKEKGVKPIEALEAPFDPVFHEAVGQLSREGIEAGIVIEVVQEGYHFGDMVLRPARVITSA